MAHMMFLVHSGAMPQIWIFLQGLWFRVAPWLLVAVSASWKGKILKPKL